MLCAQSCRAFKMDTDGSYPTEHELHWLSSAIPVKYYIGETPPKDVALSDAVNAVTSAFQVWESVPSSFIAFDYKGTTTANPVAGTMDGKNLVRWVKESEWGERPANAIAYVWVFSSQVDGRILECDIDFADSCSWSTTGLTQTFDIQNVAANEVGKFIGLGSLNGFHDKEKTMYGSFSTQEIKKRTLDEDDEAGANHIYPVIEEPKLDHMPYYTRTGDYTVSWQGGSNTDYYELQESDTPIFIAPVSNTITLNSKVYSGKPEGNYFYQVRSHGDTEGNSEWCAGDSIFVDWTPPVGSILIDSGAEFINTVGAVLYFTCIETLSGIDTTVVSNLADFSISDTSFYSDTKAWVLESGSDGTRTVYVVFYDEAANTSVVYSDTIVVDRVQPSTVTFAPVPDWTDTNSVVLDWDDTLDTMAGLLRYAVLRSDSYSGPYSEIISCDTSACADTDVLDGQEWFYRIKAYDRAGNYSVSDPDSTFVDVAAPGIPVLTFPQDNAKINDATPLFTWSIADTGSPLTFRIEVSETISFPSLTYENTVTSQSCGLTEALAVYTTYYWRVFVWDVFRSGTVSATYSFSMDTYPPQVYIQSPENGSITNAAVAVCTGTIEDSSPVNTAVLYLNGAAQVININTGTFFETITFKKGFNEISVLVCDAYGNTGSSAVSIDCITVISGAIFPSSAETTVPSAYAEITVPSGAFSETVEIAIAGSPVYDSIAVANNAAAADRNLRLVTELGGTICEALAFRIIDGVFSCTQVLTGLFNKDLEIAVFYPVSQAILLAEDALRAYYLDTGTLRWVIVPGAQTVDKVRRCVSFNVNHLSIFRIMSLSFAAQDLTGVLVYPNPFTPSSAVGGKLKFTKLTAKAVIRIYTVSGELVYTIDKAGDPTDRAEWDGKNTAGENAANGLYYYVITTEGSAEKKIGKFVVRK